MLLGLGRDYNAQASQAMGTSANLTQERRDNNKAIKETEKQNMLGMVGAGAGTGAAIGTAILPGVGTGIGAGVGAAAGLLASFF